MTANPTIRLHKGDLPPGFTPKATIAVDTEATGLNFGRDRLCLVQVSNGDGSADLVQIERENPAPNLCAILSASAITKVFHFARFDVAMLKKGLGVDTAPVFCTHVASRLTRTYSSQHSLRALCAEFLNIDLQKQQQSSDWARDTLSRAQKIYAATDVLHLHALAEHLQAMLAREGRSELARKCCAFLQTRVALDLAGWPDEDIFSHHTQ